MAPLSVDNIDFYELLGVSRTATDEEIKRAYRKAARKLHPDANPGDVEAEERFKRVTFAYEVLRDADRRRAYDTYGIDGIRGAGGTGGSSGDPYGFGVNLGDIFDAFFGGSGSPFGGRSAGPPRGPDIETVVDLSFEEAMEGIVKLVKVRIPVSCSTCDGSGSAPGTEPVRCEECEGRGEVQRVMQSFLGQMVTTSVCRRCQGRGERNTQACESCRGDGVRTEEVSREVEFPPGIASEQTLRLTGMGGAGSFGGLAGDLYVHARVAESPHFVRRGDDLFHELHLGFAQAALGTKLLAPTLEGEEDIVVKPGTQSGTVVRMRGRGAPQVQGRGRGDLIINLVVDTPTELDEEQEGLLRAFAQLRDEHVEVVDQGIFRKLKDAFR